jgi:hypothetical protein
MLDGAARDNEHSYSDENAESQRGYSQQEVLGRIWRLQDGKRNHHRRHGQQLDGALTRRVRNWVLRFPHDPMVDDSPSSRNTANCHGRAFVQGRLWAKLPAAQNVAA